VADGELNGVGPGCDDPADRAEEGEDGLLDAEKRSQGGRRGSSWLVHAVSLRAASESLSALVAADGRGEDGPVCAYVARDEE
jgi:hypothetical protein